MYNPISMNRSLDLHVTLQKLDPRPMTQISFYLTLALYGVATMLYLACLLRTTPCLSRLASRVLVAGFLAHCLAVIHRFIAAGHLPVTNMHEALSFFALSINFFIWSVSKSSAGLGGIGPDGA